MASIDGLFRVPGDKAKGDSEPTVVGDNDDDDDDEELEAVAAAAVASLGEAGVAGALEAGVVVLELPPNTLVRSAMPLLNALVTSAMLVRRLTGEVGELGDATDEELLGGLGDVEADESVWVGSVPTVGDFGPLEKGNNVVPVDVPDPELFPFLVDFAGELAADSTLLLTTSISHISNSLPASSAFSSETPIYCMAP